MRRHTYHVSHTGNTDKCRALMWTQAVPTASFWPLSAWTGWKSAGENIHIYIYKHTCVYCVDISSSWAQSLHLPSSCPSIPVCCISAHKLQVEAISCTHRAIRVSFGSNSQPLLCDLTLMDAHTHKDIPVPLQFLTLKSTHFRLSWCYNMDMWALQPLVWPHTTPGTDTQAE